MDLKTGILIPLFRLLTDDFRYVCKKLSFVSSLGLEN